MTMKATRLVLAAAAFASALIAVSPAAVAQGIVAQVNNRAITSLDVAQRVRIAALTERRRLGTREALEELIDDQAKIIEATRVGYRVTDDGVETEFAKLAKANNQSVRQFEDALRSAGLQPGALRDKMRANIAWQALLRDRVKLGTNVTRSEVETAASEKQRNVGKVVEYTLVPVVFIVPPGSSPASRIATANAQRAKFTNCETGFDVLRATPDVFIRPTMMRSSEDLSAQLKAILEKTPVGRMTAPAAGEQGIEAIAVCGKRDSTANSTDLAAVADELGEKKVNASSKAYLADIRKKVTIKYHR